MALDKLANGTILEAAFLDPAYSGIVETFTEMVQGTDEDDNVKPAQREAFETAVKTAQKKNPGLFSCCTSNEAVMDTHAPSASASRAPSTSAAAEKEQAANKTAAATSKAKDAAQNNTNKVPEGILIYKLDTTNNTIELKNEPGAKTDIGKLMTSMVIAKAAPSNDASRRGIELTGIDGSKARLVACEQRTATAWLEAMDMMLGNKKRTDASRGVAKNSGAKVSQTPKSNWGKENLDEKQRDRMEEDYLGLANYSNKLIRSGSLPHQQDGSGAGGQSSRGVATGDDGGIYYNVEFQSDQGEQYEQESLEALAKRRAVIKDSWDFYRMICSLLRDRRKYDEVFRQMQLDPVYPYLNSMTGLNDPGDEESHEKTVIQKDYPEYSNMTKTQVAQSLVKKADEALPSLVEICKALAGSLGLEEVGIGPTKETASILRKAEKKYEGDLLKITDYCRALLVVKDFSTLLALLELARDSFGPLIRRVKLSSLKSDSASLQGGYRDCKINVDIKGHICEIQIHVWPMWTVCGVDGYRHYRHCLEYSTDSFSDPFDALEGLDRKTIAEMVVMAEEAVADMPLDQLEWYQEKYILDYFAEVGLFMKHGLDVWAEVTLKQLIKLRCDSPDIGPNHHETFVLYKYHEQVLRKLGKTKEADQVAEKIEKFQSRRVKEEKDAEDSLWDSFMNAPTDAYEAMFDPNKKERLEEEELRKEVKASKKQWRKIRQERFAFLDSEQQNNSVAVQ